MCIRDSPIGQMVTQDGGRRVVGVVGGVRHVTVEQDSGNEMYIPIRQTTDFAAVELVMRTTLSRASLPSTIRSAVKPLNLNLGTSEFRTCLLYTSPSPRDS